MSDKDRAGFEPSIIQHIKSSNAGRSELQAGGMI